MNNFVLKLDVVLDEINIICNEDPVDRQRD